LSPAPTPAKALRPQSEPAAQVTGIVEPAVVQPEAVTEPNESANTPRSVTQPRRERDSDESSRVVLMREIPQKPMSWDKKTRAMSSSAVRRALAPPAKSRWLLWTITSLVFVIAVGGTAAGIWWALSGKDDKSKGSKGSAAGDRHGNNDKGGADDRGAARHDRRIIIQRVKDGHQVFTPTYRALVATDGCLTSLQVNGVEFPWVGGKT